MSQSDSYPREGSALGWNHPVSAAYPPGFWGQMLRHSDRLELPAYSAKSLPQVFPPFDLYHDSDRHLRQSHPSPPVGLRPHEDANSKLCVQPTDANLGPNRPFPSRDSRRRAARKTAKAVEETVSTQSCPDHGEDVATKAACESNVLSLSKVLSSLTHLPPDHICLVRKIFYLGSDAASALQLHFEAFGIVESVIIPESHVKRAGRYASTSKRTRPASLAVIVMAEALAVDKAMQAGSQQSVAGCLVSVERYECRGDPREESCDESSVGSGHGSRRSLPNSKQSVTVAEYPGTCDIVHLTEQNSFEYWATDDEAGF